MKISIYNFFILCLMMLFSCRESRLQNKKPLSKNGKKYLNDSILKPSQKKGIDFIASGNMPQEWNIEMDFDNEYNFIKKDGFNIKAKSNANFKIDAMKEVYSASFENNILEVIVLKEKCNKKNHEQTNTSVTKVSYLGVTYEGCGRFLFDERLHQTWVLDYIDNEPQFAINYAKGIPYFKFDLIKNKITGFDGCNKLSSSIELKGNRILFGSLNNMPDKSLQSAALINQFVSNHLVDYFFREDKLVFQLANDTRLTFKLKEN